MICLVQYLYWEANKGSKDRFLECRKCLFHEKCNDPAKTKGVMMTKRVTRAQLRGKPLDEDCKRFGRSDPGQYGSNDKRCFCTGMWDRMRDEFYPKCRECKAWNANAEPPEEVEL